MRMISTTIEDNGVIVRLVDVDEDIKGWVADSSDGAHNIYLNARHTYKTILDTYRHELRHIWREDFASDNPVADLEE